MSQQDGENGGHAGAGGEGTGLFICEGCGWQGLIPVTDVDGYSSHVCPGCQVEGYLDCIDERNVGLYCCNIRCNRFHNDIRTMPWVARSCSQCQGLLRTAEEFNEYFFPWLVTPAPLQINEPPVAFYTPASRMPVSDSAVRDLTSVAVDDDLVNEMCAICRNNFQVGEDARELPCKHHFHTACIENWFKLHNTCPICRSNLPVSPTGGSGGGGSGGGGSGGVDGGSSSGSRGVDGGSSSGSRGSSGLRGGTSDVPGVALQSDSFTHQGLSKGQLAPRPSDMKGGAPDHWRLVRAHGTAVGLPTEDNMCNSEVGHNACGAQGAKLVDQALASGRIYQDEGFNYIKESFVINTFHLIVLMSDGGVHSRLDQLQLLLNGACEHGAKKIRVHVLTDGRDVLDGSSVGFAETLEAELASLMSKGIDAQVASGGGRMYVTMDRYENDWEVVKHGWDAQVLGEEAIIKTLRQAPGANDQYLPPFVIVDDSGSHVGPIVDGDAVVTVNFRADRMTMLAQALEFEKFDRMILDTVEQVGGIYVVTADHSNAEDMVKRNKKGEPILKDGEVQILTSHTLRPVPIAIGGPGLSDGVRFRKDVPSGGLANVAATVMNLHGFVAPENYETTLIH